MSALNTSMTLDDYLALEYPFNVTVDPDEQGYVVEFPDLPGCMTQVESLADLSEMAEEARILWIETALEDGVEIPLPSYPETYSGKFNLRLPKSLHRKLAGSARREGISLNQHVVALLSESASLHALEVRLTRVERVLASLSEEMSRPLEDMEGDELEMTKSLESSESLF